MKYRMKTRERGDNWTSREKEIITEIMKDSAKIVDIKSIDAKSVMQKNSEWLKVQKKFCDLSGSTRSIHQLKGVWRRIRHSTTIHSQNKIDLKETEGGKKSPCPSQEDRQIRDISSTDFNIVKVEYDNDSILQTADMQESDAVIIEPEIFDNKTNCDSKFKQNMVEQEETNINMKKKRMKRREDEQTLKIRYWQKELSHQELKHKLELEILTLEKRKKELEILKLN